MNVRGPLVGGFDQNLVHQFHDACFGSFFGSITVVGGNLFEQLNGIFFALLHQGINCLTAHPVMLADHASDFFGIGHLAGAYPADLSYGHRKRCELARAVAQEPAVMLLDEPVAGINAQEAEGIAQAVRRLRDAGIAVLLVEHNMDFVMGLSDRITVLDYGEVIAAGTPDEIRRDRRVIEAYLGSEEAAE